MESSIGSDIFGAHLTKAKHVQMPSWKPSDTVEDWSQANAILSLPSSYTLTQGNSASASYMANTLR